MTKCDPLPEIKNTISLNQMRRGDSGMIVRLEGPDHIVQRLVELGIVEKSQVQILHEAPFGKDPIAVQVRGGLVALRRKEASYIFLKKVPLL